jgi:hypothetical protein
MTIPEALRFAIRVLLATAPQEMEVFDEILRTADVGD